MSGSKTDPQPEKLPQDNLIEIHDPEIDPQAIMAEIRARIEERRQELGYVEKRFSTFGGAQFPGRPDDVPYDPEFYDHLELANELYLQAPTKADLQPSPAIRIPLLGPLWAMIREQAHALVLYYVNRSVSHQTAVDREIIGVLNKMTAVNLEQQRTINRLQAEVDALRQELSEKKG